MHVERLCCTWRQRHLRCRCYAGGQLVFALLPIWLCVVFLGLPQARTLAAGLITIACDGRGAFSAEGGGSLLCHAVQRHASASLPVCCNCQGHAHQSQTPGEGGRWQSAATPDCRLPMQASSCGRNRGPPSSVAMSSCRSARVAAAALTATLLSGAAILRSDVVLPCASSGVPSACCAMG